MRKSVEQMLSGYKTICWTVTRNTEETKKAIQTLETKEDDVILIIDKAHLLFLQPYFFPSTCNLKLVNFPFVVAISEDPLDPKEENHPFWKQFKVKVCNSLPNTTFYKELLMYYFKKWETHWTYSATRLSEEDYIFLANCCAFCTSRNVKNFCRNVFSFIRNAYPDEKIDLDIKLLMDVNNLLLFKPFNASAEDYCIINEDASEKQRLYDPLLRSLTISVKRSRIEPPESTGDIVGGTD
jgi:hypothetical protein